MTTDTYRLDYIGNIRGWLGMEFDIVPKDQAEAVLLTNLRTGNYCKYPIASEASVRSHYRIA